MIVGAGSECGWSLLESDATDWWRGPQPEESLASRYHDGHLHGKQVSNLTLRGPINVAKSHLFFDAATGQENDACMTPISFLRHKGTVSRDGG
jgi:hypothetical protein